jgi:hypothetical protein
MTDYKQKYLKYKNKYIQLKNEINGGGFAAVSMAHNNLQMHNKKMLNRQNYNTYQNDEEKDKIKKNRIIELCKINNDNCDNEKILLYYEKLYDYNNDLIKYNTKIDTYKKEYDQILKDYNFINEKDKQYIQKYEQTKIDYDENVKKHTVTGSLFLKKPFDTYEKYLRDIYFNSDNNNDNDKILSVLNYQRYKLIKPLTIEEYIKKLEKPVKPIKSI